MIKAVFIDIDDTLLDFHKCAEISIKLGFEEYSIEYNGKVFDTFLSINEGLWKQLEKGEIDRADIYAVRWKKIFDALNINKDGVEFEKTFRRFLAESYQTVEGAEETLSYLAKKYITCAASNAPYEQQLYRLERAGLKKYFNYIFVSEKIGFVKPDIRFFEECIKELDGVSKDEIMIIGDSLTADIKGGKAFGIKTCWFNRKGEKASEIIPDITISSLSELKTIL